MQLFASVFEWKSAGRNDVYVNVGPNSVWTDTVTAGCCAFSNLFSRQNYNSIKACLQVTKVVRLDGWKTIVINKPDDKNDVFVLF